MIIERREHVCVQHKKEKKEEEISEPTMEEKLNDIDQRMHMRTYTFSVPNRENINFSKMLSSLDSGNKLLIYFILYLETSNEDFSMMQTLKAKPLLEIEDFELD